MANVSETSEFTAGIYQLETTDDVVGGADGISNLQAKQLANRTLFLKNLIESEQKAGQKAIAEITGTTTLTLADHAGKWVFASNEAGTGGSYNVTLPSLSDVTPGVAFMVKNATIFPTGSDNVVLVADGTDKIGSGTTHDATSVTLTEGQMVKVVATGTMWQVVS